MKSLLLFLLALQTPEAELERLEAWAKTQPENGPGKVSVGDEYYKASKKFPKERLRFIDKANEAWTSGWPMLQDVWKDKVRQNLRKMFQAQGPVAPLPKLWITDGASASPERVRTGRFGAKILATKDGALHHSLKATFTVPSGVKQVEVSAWVLTDETESSEDDLKVVAYGSGGNVVKADGASIPQDMPAWTKLSVTLPTEGAQKITVYFEFRSTKGVAFVDDIDVKAGDKVLFK